MNENLAEAHAALAAAIALYHWDAAGAFEAFERAIALNPGYASAWHFYGVILIGRGQYERALHALERAHALDPLAPIIRVQIASLHYLTRRYREADRICDEVTRLHPDFWPARWFAGMSLQQQGRSAEAGRYLETATEMSNRSPLCLAALGHLAGSTGRVDVAQSIARELQDRRAERHSPAIAVALVYLGMGDRSTALQWLNTAVQERSPFLAMFLWGDARLDPIRSEPQFIRTLQTIGILPGAEAAQQQPEA